MKNLIVTLAAAAMIATTANVNAQPKGGERPQQTPEQRVQMYKDRLGISDEQGAKILKIYQDAEAQSANLTGQQEKMEAMKKTRAEVDKVLTPEQREKVKEMYASHGQGQPQGKPQAQPQQGQPQAQQADKAKKDDAGKAAPKGKSKKAPKAKKSGGEGEGGGGGDE